MNKNSGLLLLGKFDGNDLCEIEGVNIFKYNWQPCLKKRFVGYGKIVTDGIQMYKIDLTEKQIYFGARKNKNSYDVFSLSKEYLKEISILERMYINSLSDDEKIIKQAFAYLFNEYGFTYIKTNLGDAYDAEGRFFFYGPVYAHSIYNNDICINVLNLVQRQDYDLFITDKYLSNQVYIRQGKHIADWNMNLADLSDTIRQSLLKDGTIFCCKINKLN